MLYGSEAVHTAASQRKTWFSIKALRAAGQGEDNGNRHRARALGCPTRFNVNTRLPVAETTEGIPELALFLPRTPFQYQKMFRFFSGKRDFCLRDGMVRADV